MRHPDPAFSLRFGDPRGRRRHRFMESADINAAFEALFEPLRTNIRRGLRTDGQLYGIEMDGCIPGQLLGTCWIPPASLGIGDAAMLADAERRRALYGRLFEEPRAEALFAYVCEPPAHASAPVLFLEIASSDARHAAEHPILPGHGWHRRELQRAPQRRL